MAYCKVELKCGFTVISNELMRDKRLSLKAKGLQALILSLPPDWDMHSARSCSSSSVDIISSRKYAFASSRSFQALRLLLQTVVTLCVLGIAISGVFNIASYLQKFYCDFIIADKTTRVQRCGMIVIILVKGAAKCGFSPVHCAVMRIDFFEYLCCDMENGQCFRRIQNFLRRMFSSLPKRLSEIVFCMNCVFSCFKKTEKQIYRYRLAAHTARQLSSLARISAFL